MNLCSLRKFCALVLLSILIASGAVIATADETLTYKDITQALDSPP
jgi:hypothetical protein